MNEKTKWIVGIVAVLICSLVALGGYWVGTWGRVSQSEYDRLKAERDGLIKEQWDTVGKLEGILESAQGRVVSIEDRNRRIEILFDAIAGTVGDLEKFINVLREKAERTGSSASIGDSIH